MLGRRIFVSYSHDSPDHRARVLALSERLRADGIETLLDQYVNGSPLQGWPRWMLDQLDTADSVLVVCTETYYRRFRGHEKPGKGKGVDWEGALITQEIYDSRSGTLKFVPIFLAPAVESSIPEPLRQHTYYSVTSEDSYQALYDFLLGQAGVEPGAVGEVRPKPRRSGTPLSFARSPSSEVARFDITRIIKYAPVDLIGREAETALLSKAWEKVCSGESARPHVLTFVALGGEGKTSLVAKWAADLAHQGWPGCDAAFAWSFYSQGTRDQVAASSDNFLKDALTFFGDTALADSAQGAFEKGRRLAQLVGERRALLILDGMEPLQYAPASPTPGELKDQGLASLLKGLAAAGRGLCVVTTRYSILDLRGYWQTSAPEEQLLRLSQGAGVALLRSLGVRGAPNEFGTLVQDVRGHALTLNLLGTYLRDAHAGDIRKRDLVKLEEADSEQQGGHAFRVMDAYTLSFEHEGERGARALGFLRLLGLFDRPATADCLGALLRPPAISNLTGKLVGMTHAQLNLALTRLESARLLTVNRDAARALISVDAHPLVREYFGRQLQRHRPDALREAHARIYEHLSSTTQEGDQPRLEDLQPLYQAIVHGCQAGLYQEALDDIYFNRINKMHAFYSTDKLGLISSDLGAVACFFEVPWRRPSPALLEPDRIWLLSQAGYRLRALGRLTEAREPMQMALAMRVDQKAWKHASITAGNLSELVLALGEVSGAVEHAKESVSYADQGEDPFQRLTKRAAYGCALHAAGRHSEALGVYREAESIQKVVQPDYPLLYALAGFRYCDLLLTPAERVAWQVQIGGTTGTTTQALESVREVDERARQTLRWMEHAEADLFSLAIDPLTMGRASLYGSILEGHDFLTPVPWLSIIERSVSGLRRAGQLDYLPFGLLTRAWVRSILGVRSGPESAASDLDEAWEIAERGPMPLFLADIHLHRARLFFREAKYPWDSPRADLAEARSLINRHGYNRRMEELEEAERVLLRSPVD